MNNNTFEIFSGKPDKEPIWVEAVEGLANAIERMEHIAAQKPGEYFVFSLVTHSTLARVQAFSQPPQMPKGNNQSNAA